MYHSMSKIESRLTIAGRKIQGTQAQKPNTPTPQQKNVGGEQSFKEKPTATNLTGSDWYTASQQELAFEFEAGILTSWEHSAEMAGNLL